MLARKFSSVGEMRWPRLCRARNATLRPSRFPRTYESEGSPKGVLILSSLRSLKPGMEYSPLPPIMPISAFCKKTAPELWLMRKLDYTERKMSAWLRSVQRYRAQCAVHDRAPHCVLQQCILSKRRHKAMPGYALFGTGLQLCLELLLECRLKSFGDQHH